MNNQTGKVKIKFKKKRLIFTLIFAIVWLGLGIYSFFENERSRWPNFMHLFFGAAFLGQFLFDLKYQYLIIDNGIIVKNKLIGSTLKMKLDDIYLIKHFAGDYTLYTKEKKLTIHTNKIDEQSFLELKNILTHLNLPTEKTPFKAINEIDS